MKHHIFAANWKMHLGPQEARAYLQAFFKQLRVRDDREIWFFPPAISLTTVLDLIKNRPGLRAGAQNVHWAAKGAFTGETSIPMLVDAGAHAALVGHSERRHVFGETEDQAGKKARALLEAGLVPVFCVGEQLAEREAGETWSVVQRQLKALHGLPAATLGRVVIAYEPVWAIGTGRNATPADAAEVHRSIRGWFAAHGVRRRNVAVLYGGSVNLKNAAELLAEAEVDGVLVGGASLDPAAWAKIVQTGV